MSKRDPLSLPASIVARWRRGLTLRSFANPAPPASALTREARVITQNNTPRTTLDEERDRWTSAFFGVDIARERAEKRRAEQEGQ